MEGGSWTNNISWVRGYEKLLGPMESVSALFARKVLAEKPSEFDPRKYLGPARDELIKMMMKKNRDVLGSAGKA